MPCKGDLVYWLDFTQPYFCQVGCCDAIIASQMDDKAVYPARQRFVVAPRERIPLPRIPAVVGLVIRLALSVKAIEFVQVVLGQVRLSAHTSSRPIAGHHQIAFHRCISAVNPARNPGLAANGGSIVCGTVIIVISQVKGRIISRLGKADGRNG